MKKGSRTIRLCVITLGFSVAASAADMIITLPGAVSQKKVMLRCDEHAQAMGLPHGAFTVTYLNSDGNSLAVLPINGRPLIFAGVLSADGSRYAADRFIWWDVGSRGIHLYADGLNKEQTACRASP